MFFPFFVLFESFVVKKLSLWLQTWLQTLRKDGKDSADALITPCDSCAL